MDVNNKRGDALATVTVGMPVLPADYIVGLDIAGSTVSTFRSTVAAMTSGGHWQYGWAVMGTDVSEAAFFEFSNPGAKYGLLLAAPHIYGVFVTSAAAVNQFNGPVAVGMQGSTITASTPLDVRTATDNRVVVRDKVNLANGISIYSINDANNATRGMEFGASSYLFSGSGSAVFGGGSIATTATDGFVYIRACAGTPTGVPTAQTGRVPMVFDTTNNKLWIYNGAWKGVVLA